MRKTIIFCDFDGTITMNDNIIAIMRHFQPEGWELLLDQVMAKSISIKVCIGDMFSLLPSSLKTDVIQYALDNMQIRPGFSEFISYCENRGIEFLVTSGGIDFFVRPTLAPFQLPSDHIFCNQSDFSKEQMTILWPHPCDEHCGENCGMCKTTIIRSYDPELYLRIMIGDSITDFAGAKLADVIFARSHLAEECKKLNMPYYAYEDFYEIAAQLNVMLEK